MRKFSLSEYVVVNFWRLFDYLGLSFSEQALESNDSGLKANKSLDAVLICICVCQSLCVCV